MQCKKLVIHLSQITAGNGINTKKMNTRDLSQLGYREINILQKLLKAYCENGTPDEFTSDGLTFEFNQNSGVVFLTNDDYQVLVLGGTDEAPELEMFYSSPYEGIEGTFEELEEEFINMHPEDQEWFNEIRENR